MGVDGKGMAATLSAQGAQFFPVLPVAAGTSDSIFIRGSMAKGIIIINFSQFTLYIQRGTGQSASKNSYLYRVPSYTLMSFPVYDAFLAYRVDTAPDGSVSPSTPNPYILIGLTPNEASPNASQLLTQFAGIGQPTTIADGADVAQGTTTDAGTANTIVGRLERIRAIFNLIFNSVLNAIGVLQPPGTGRYTTAAANTAVVQTIAGVAGQQIRLFSLVPSYSGVPTAGNIQIQDGATVIFNLDITLGGAFNIILPDGGLAASTGNSMVITLSAGGAAVIGKVNSVALIG